jgi:hypothetical protein
MEHIGRAGLRRPLFQHTGEALELGAAKEREEDAADCPATDPLYGWAPPVPSPPELIERTIEDRVRDLTVVMTDLLPEDLGTVFGVTLETAEAVVRLREDRA